MSDNNETPNDAVPTTDDAAPTPEAPPHPVIPPAPAAGPAPSAAAPTAAEAPKPPRMWPASTVIAAGVATVLLSGLVGGFIGAALSGADHGGRQDRFANVDRDSFGGRMDRMPGGPGSFGGPRGYGGDFNGPGQQGTPGGASGTTQG